jgi:hypothetical protein
MAGAVIGGVVTAIGAIAAASAQSSAAKSVANQQIKASGEVAKIQDDAAKRQETFLKEQDALDRQAAETKRRQEYDTTEAGRKMTYDQWLSRQKNLAPYQGIGKASVGTLGHLMGYTPAQQTMPDPGETVPYQPIPYTPLPTAPATLPPETPAASSFSAPETPTPAPVAAPATTPEAPAPSAALVWMQAPDGTKKAVPSFSVPHFQRLGAKVIETPSFTAGV